MSAAAEAIIEFVIRLIIDFIFTWTGEIVLFVVTFGKRKPSWDLHSREDAGTFVFLSELSFWIGFTFWLLVGYLIYKFSRV
ncbi:MAG: hypothetical protein FJ395_19125 [Verrucomicrobia bacterium]|nr:hypothetical protein [Verrucomicrobiota bacterium]